MRHVQPPLEPAVRRSGLGLDHLHQSSAEVKDKIELHFHLSLSLMTRSGLSIFYTLQRLFRSNTVVYITFKKVLL